MLEDYIGFIDDVIWNDVLTYVLLGAGIFFTFRLRLLQIRRFPEMLRTLARPAVNDPAGISPFQALCASLAARIGTGNVVGVAVALYLGGPGAAFWMWLVAALGMATAFAEVSLAQLFKVRAGDAYRGGPAFYIARGLQAPRAAMVFSICLIIVFGLAFNAVQANSIAGAAQEAFGVAPLWTGVAVTIAAALVISGGVTGVARFSAVVVPVMAVAYIAVALAVLAINIDQTPALLKLIVSSAFGFGPAAGGVAGGMTAAMMNGVRRGLFSNEAGMGSAPNIAAVATPSPHHPCSQGFVQALGVFIDTLVVCTATALLILLSGKLQPGSGVTGVQLTQQAMNVHLGHWGAPFVSIAITCFAFTSIAGNYAYAEGALAYLRFDGRAGLLLLRLGLLAMTLWGAMAQVSTVFGLADITMGVMAAINIASIVLLSGLVVRLARDYLAQRDAGREPEFDPALLPELAGVIEPGVWDRPPAAGTRVAKKVGEPPVVPVAATPAAAPATPGGAPRQPGV